MLVSACSSSSKKVEAPAPAAAEVPEAAPAAAEVPEAAPAAVEVPATVPAATSSGSTATVGQQLTDLNQARESGAITDEEYEAAKKKLLDSQ